MPQRSLPREDRPDLGRGYRAWGERAQRNRERWWAFEGIDQWPVHLPCPAIQGRRMGWRVRGQTL